MVPIGYNVRSLFIRKTTTVATALGIALVVFVLAASLMLAAGVRKTLGSSGSRDNAIVIRKGSDTEMASSIEGPTIGLIEATPGVARDEAGQPLAVDEVVMVILLDKVGTDGGVSNIQVRGVPANALAFRPQVRIVAGRPAQPGTDEVIVGQRISGRFRGLELDGRFDLKKNRPVHVVGVFSAGGSSFESEVWADVETVRSSFGRGSYASSVTVRLEAPSKLDAFAAQVEHDKRLGLDAMREDKYYEKQSEDTARFVTATGWIIAVLFSLGAMIGAMITMYAAVAQRKREIGTLRALGFSRLSILFSFLLEALFLAAVGGALGCAAALAMGLVELSMINFATFSEIVFRFEPEPGILIRALIFGSVMGVLGGLFPAIRAARISPIAAMRD
jgi:putative ABC transport system permease protein